MHVILLCPIIIKVEISCYINLCHIRQHSLDQYRIKFIYYQLLDKFRITIILKCVSQ